MLNTDLAAGNAAIGLRKAENGTGGTRFGGHPNLAARIRWPHDSAGRPMHHLLQLDCAALPFVDPDMPRSGTLMFFVTGSYEERSAPALSETSGRAFAVIYQPAAAADTPERPHPHACPALGESSYACNPVRHEIPQKKMSFFQRLVNTQPKPYSKSGGTGYFSAVPLAAQVFDSFPTSDPKAVFDVFEAHENPVAQEYGLRPLQVMGYAPQIDDLTQAHAAGYRACSDEKALAAYEMGVEREDILLVQLPHAPELNLDLIDRKYVLQFRISRADLRARAFDKVKVEFADHGLDGKWWLPEETASPYVPNADDLRPEIVLKLLTPFEQPSFSGNFFCGEPQLPASLEWPCMRDGYPLGFLMQIDCASLPRTITVGGRSLELPEFPRAGTIFLFAYDFLDEVTGETVRVLYTPEDVAGLPHRQAPEALKTLPEYSDSKIKQRADFGEVPLPENARPFEPVAFANIAEPHYADPEFSAKDAYYRKYGGALPHEDHAYPGVELLVGWLPNYRAVHFENSRRTQHTDVTEPVRYIPECYPWRWGDIASATEFFPYDRFKHVGNRHRDAVFGLKLIAEGEAWKKRASACGSLDRIPEAERAAYRRWLLDMDACRSNIPAETRKESRADYRLRQDLLHAFEGIMKRLAQPFPYLTYGSLPDTLHYLAFDPDADDLRDEMREVVAEVLRFHRSDTQLRGNNTVHGPNPDLMFTSAAEGQASASEVLLFTLASGSGLPVVWADCCWLQIWIEAEDLAAGRFERIRPTIKW